MKLLWIIASIYFLTSIVESGAKFDLFSSIYFFNLFSGAGATSDFAIIWKPEQQMIFIHLIYFLTKPMFSTSGNGTCNYPREWDRVGWLIYNGFWRNIGFIFLHWFFLNLFPGAGATLDFPSSPPHATPIWTSRNSQVCWNWIFNRW